MKDVYKIALIFTCYFFSPCFAQPPKVIKMIPENGAVDVKPGPCKIRILFDQDMAPGYSICRDGGNHPETIGEPKWAGKRAIVMKVNLKPNREYSFTINDSSAQNFTNVKGEPAEITAVKFRTGDNDTNNQNNSADDSERWKNLSLLDSQTQSQLEGFESFFDKLFQFSNAYQNASAARKNSFEQRWIEQLQNGTTDKAIEAAAYLGYIRSEKAAKVIAQAMKNSGRGGRFRWVCTRSLGQIGQESSIPVFINLLDNQNSNTRVYAQVSLVSITGVNFGDNKQKWQAWYDGPDNATSGEETSLLSNEDISTVEANKIAFEALKTAILYHYSYRDMKGLDWPALFDQYQQQLVSAGSGEEFVRAAILIVGKARDKHLWFDANGRRISSYVKPSVPNANFETIQKVVPGFKKQSNIVYSGRYNIDIGYIQINSWSTQQEKALDGFFVALNELSDTKGLIVDVRFNGGGDEGLARQVAGCFIDEPKLYAKNISIDPGNPGEFTQVHSRYVKPNKSRPQYRGKVAVLIGPKVMSSCEAFVLMMKQVPGCVLIGEPTQGSSGNPKPYDLGNGVTVYLPSWQAMLPDGTCFEGKGIEPDILVKARPDQFNQTDPVIKAALKELATQ